MPEIKAYKNNGVVIPVDKAKIGKAYQCPFTDKIYSTKSAYIEHLKKRRASTLCRNNSMKRHQRKLENLRSQTSIDDIANWIEMNPEFFINNLILNDTSSGRSYLESIICDFSITVTSLMIEYDDNVRNSHSAPFGKPTNWHRSDNLPKGYPGWQGDIEYTVSHYISNDLFTGTGINTGSGGGDTNKYCYEVVFFQDDWPGLTRS